MRCPFKLPLSVLHDKRGWSMLLDADGVSVTSFAGPGHIEQADYTSIVINGSVPAATAPAEVAA